MSENVCKSEKTSPTHKNLTDSAVDIEIPCGAKGEPMFFREIKTMSMFGNGKNDRKSHLLTNPPFWSLVLQGFQAAGLHATSCRLRH